MTYSSKSPEFGEDLARLVDIYRKLGLAVASNTCAAISALRGLNASQRLTLADAFRRRIILEE